MRIITGKLKGRIIRMPNTSDVRPTADRTKESLFNIIEVRAYLEGANVLDLFAGSGNLGFEAISRGVKQVLFVDKSSGNIKHIEKTASSFKVESQIRTRIADVRLFLEGPAIPYDFIFCDPPYDYDWMLDMVDTVLSKKWLTDDGWFILEHDRRHQFSEHPHCFFSKAYGRTTVSIFQKLPVD